MSLTAKVYKLGVVKRVVVCFTAHTKPI